MAKQITRLYKYFRPENYKLELIPDRDKMSFSGKVIITGKKTGPPSSRLTFHQKGLKIKSAKITKLDKKGDKEFSVLRINTHQKFDELRIHTNELLYGGMYKVEISFSGLITETMHGIYPCYYENHNKMLIATQFESHHAREVFPNIDEPQAKATFDLCLTTPKGEVVLANTEIKIQTTKNNQLTTTFETTPIMSPYLLAFVYGELVYKEAKTKQGIIVRSYATPSNQKLLDYSVDVGVKSIDFFENYFYTPYPLTKLDMVALPEFSSGAMENWGLITYRESILLTDPKSTSIESQQITALVITHEVAHMWFGNLVTMEWWDDLWLNESFANVMEYIATDSLFPEWEIWDQFVNTEMHSAMQRDSLPNVQPVRTRVNHPDEIGPLFDPAIVYAKGGNILNMIRHKIGEEDFRDGLKNYFKKYQYGNTKAADLWLCLSQTSGIDVDDFMHNWLNYPGFPVVEIDYAPEEQNFTVSQKRLVNGKDENAQPTTWQVPFATITPTNEAQLSTRSGNFSFNTLPKTPIFNHDGHSYYVPRYTNKQHLDVLLQMISQKQLNVIDRLLLIQGYYLLERSAEISTNENLELIVSYGAEDDEAVWSSIAATLGNVRRLVKGNDIAESNFNKFVAGLIAKQVKKVGWKSIENESSQSRRMRSLMLALGVSAEMPDVLKKANSLFVKIKQADDLPSDIRGAVYYGAARFGLPADFKKLLSLYRTTVKADEKDEIASALCASKDVKHIKTLLAMIMTKEVRLQNVVSWFIWLLRNFEARLLTWQWMVDNWPWIEKHYASDKSYDYFPRLAASTFSTPQELLMFKKFFDPKAKIPALERTIMLGLEEMEGKIAWRAKNENEVKLWLANRVDPS